jgi:hypothetical protein
VIFEWDKNKNASNIRKHDLSFEDAVEVFDDPNYLIERSYDDPATGEPRWKAIGLIPSRISEVAVIHVSRKNEWKTKNIGEEPEEVVRVISARRANPGESRRYQAG